MCGIAGIIDWNGTPDGTSVQAMLSRIVHRGPDDQGIHVSGGPAVIGMRRLSIIDIAGGHQPIANEDGTIWVVSNGEIYNYKSLRKELQAQGHSFRTESDTEVIVHGYEQWGEKFLTRLEGMFGLAVWDERRDVLTLARDPLGMKPLYYCQVGERFAFASEMKALLALPWVPRKLDQVGLEDYLTLGYAVAPNTLIAAIRKVCPGERLTLSRREQRRDRFWRLPLEVEHGVSESVWADRIRTEFGRAVQDHLVSDVPLGAFLSGGIDSSSIVALMSGSGSDPVNSYAIGYAGSTVASYYDELPFARAVAERYETNHREIGVQPNVAELLPKLMWHLEEPISDTATMTTFLVSELAAKSVKVILSGVGGDELFGGYTRYLGEHYNRRYQRIPHWIRSGVIQPAADLLPSGRSSRLLDLARHAKRFIQSSHLDDRSRYREYVSLGPTYVMERLFDAGAGTNGMDRSFADLDSSDWLQTLFAIDTQTQLAEGLLLLSDKMSMAVSIECRVPFLDRRLVELAARIPGDLKVPNGQLKHLFKQSMANILPESVVNRSKRGFGAPMGAWLQSELRPMRSLLLGAGASNRMPIDPGAVQTICDLHDRSKEDFSDLIMVLMNLELWSRIFLDDETPDDVAGDLSDRLKAA